MGSKRFVTSRAPTTNTGNGAAVILNNSIYAVKTGKGSRRHKKRRNGINQVGGNNVTSFDNISKSFTVKGIYKGQEYVHRGVIRATTTIKQSTRINYKCKVGKVKVVLFDETTYTSGMIASRDAEKIVKVQDYSSHKVRQDTRRRGQTGVLGMATRGGNGRRVIRDTTKVSSHKETVIIQQVETKKLPSNIVDVSKPLIVAHLRMIDLGAKGIKDETERAEILKRNELYYVPASLVSYSNDRVVVYSPSIGRITFNQGIKHPRYVLLNGEHVE